MTAELELFPTDTSPFDAIRRQRTDGTEFWSARDLMPLLGYPTWQHFVPAIDRARSAAVAQGNDVDVLFTVSREKSGGRPREDFHLARFACYLVAMNGDPRKPEVAAAQAYFAIRTREAETRPAAVPSGPELLALAVVEAQQMLAAKDEKIAALEPKAEFYDELMESDGTYSLNSVAHMLGWGRNVMMRELRKLGVLQGNNLPYRRYDHHFKVVPGTYTNRHTGETVPTATTYVLPSGIDFLRRKLAEV